MGDQIKEDGHPHMARVGEKRNTYRVSVGKPEGKGLLGKGRHTWAHNIKMILKKYVGRA